MEALSVQRASRLDRQRADVGKHGYVFVLDFAGRGRGRRWRGDGFADITALRPLFPAVPSLPLPKALRLPHPQLFQEQRTLPTSLCFMRLCAPYHRSAGGKRPFKGERGTHPYAVPPSVPLHPRNARPVRGELTASLYRGEKKINEKEREENRRHAHTRSPQPTPRKREQPVSRGRAQPQRADSSRPGAPAALTASPGRSPRGRLARGPESASTRARAASC